ncbi:Elongator complex protein 4 [Phlyctochytrium arcticum]|nr:Elongator complex protein 4 [Phlyctochytrium arcticum]
MSTLTSLNQSFHIPGQYRYSSGAWRRVDVVKGLLVAVPPLVGQDLPKTHIELSGSGDQTVLSGQSIGSTMSSFKRRTPSSIPILPGTRISPHTSTQQTSTGIPSLDTLLRGGLQTGSLTLLQSDQYTEYAKLVASYYIAQGVVSGHAINFISAEGEGEAFMAGLMGETKRMSSMVDDDGADKEKDSGPVSDRPPIGLRDVDGDKMRIAWRYQNLPHLTADRSSTPNSTTTTPYCATFDLTKKMDIVQLKRTKMALVDIGQWISEMEDSNNYETLLDRLYTHIETLIDQGGFRITPSSPSPPALLRIYIQSLLSPLWPVTSGAQQSHALFRFLYHLRNLLRQSTAVCLISLPTPFPIPLTPLYHAADTVITLTSFASHPSPYDGEYSGLIDIVKSTTVGCLPITTAGELGGMGFRVRRKRFEIERVALPPEEEEKGRGEVKKGCGAGAKNVLDF